MEKTYFLVLFCFSLNIFKTYGYQSIHKYTKPQVITTPNYPEPYPPYFNCTWKWSKDSGIWAVLFEDLSVSCDDWVYVEDVQSSKKYPEGCSHSTMMPIYIHGSELVIRFSTTENRNLHSGFKIRILSGCDLDDVKVQVYEIKEKGKETMELKTNHVHTLLYILLAIIGTIVCFVALLMFIFKHRRNRSQSESLSVAVSVNHIRRGTGVSYKRSASTSESISSNDTETAKVEIERKRVTRTPSQRSWTARAALATKSNVAVDNLYSPIGHYENQINRPLSALIEYDPLSKPVPSANVHPTTISGYEAPVIPK
ncbi:hypothetical protein LOTGIDRAFT_231612 [Lottia gigantea]|uniref:CUB domain-containing protein n=1 Tax=Lottia gigantea TaxID=225164 RepID=V4C711_LOTGI|nr:hypothetical protein LOTGIDRAFT_231612 [Lottia gigantea]ESO97454.1 hypothetical protein LOTGIDRAFT_231612 [Lottia gigantea]